ncbi:hypothetical protein Tco_0980684 [Tanacetum coccineum]
MSIPDVMVNDDIKNSKAYKTYLAISTGIMVPKKARKGMKTTDAPKKKGSITAVDNIIPNLEEALKLGKSINRTKVEEQEEARRVHETHERLVTEKPTSDQSSDESDDEQEEVPNEPKGKSTGSNEGVGITPEVPDKPNGKFVAQDDDWGYDEEKVILFSDDERTESEKEMAESEKADEESVDEEEVHLDNEVYNEENKQIDDEAHDDEYVHDDVEKHDDAD